jgi:NTE family protein
MTMNKKKPTRLVFGIFEGGGAKGVSHVGALKAAEEDQLRFIGVAGASAGAIIAALIGVGFTADELMEPATGKNILARYDKSPLDLLGRDEWTRGKGILSLKRRINIIKWTGLIGMVLVNLQATLLIRKKITTKGYFSTQPIREFLNTVLRDKLIEIRKKHGFPTDTVPSIITFRDLDTKLPLPALKIVATDVHSKQLSIFDRNLTQDVAIADAVCASLAIPMVFEPVEIRDRLYADGGLVSNLPTWVFAEEKLAFERAIPHLLPVPVVGFSLVDGPEKTDSKGSFKDFLSYITAVARSAIFGSQHISKRFVKDLSILKLTSTLSVLDFDAKWGALQDAYYAGKDAAEDQIRRNLTLQAHAVRAQLQSSLEAVRRAINNERASQGRPPLEHIRASIIQRFGEMSCRVTHGVNMDDDADDRLILDRDGQGAPQVFSAKDIRLFILSGPNSVTNSFMTKYEKALVRPTLLTGLGVPIFADNSVWETEYRPEPLGVLSFDSDEDLTLDYASNALKRVLAKESLLIGSILKIETTDV